MQSVCLRFFRLLYTINMRHKVKIPHENVNVHPSSQFKNALRKLNRSHSSKRKCELIKNASDEFIKT